MKTKILLFSLSTLLSFFVQGQSNLIVSNSSRTVNTFKTGNYLTFNATVSNIGNDSAYQNFMFVYLSQSNGVFDDDILTRISIKTLQGGESQEISFKYPLADSLSTGNYYIVTEIDPFNTVQESDEYNFFCITNNGVDSVITISNSLSKIQKNPYPIIFVHGWTGNSDTWEDFSNEAKNYYGWSFGGRLDYCLNPDGSQYTSDGYIRSFVNINELSHADYYYLNFDVSIDGTLFVGNDGITFNDNYSNQSAITKQGMGVKDAVNKVLSITGAEKVILVGHSMGGLACREYLQNQYNWQSDNKHHVAKLLTVATPNGGSNSSLGSLGVFFGYDEMSEAVRDLRYSSFLHDGLFLDGGEEDNWSIYYNDDVNCNGYVGDNIIGLNQKYSPSDVNYSCIVGIGNNFPIYEGDGVVEEDKADLNNFIMSRPPLANLHADRFNVLSAHTDIHKKNHSTLIQGFDEPNMFTEAYPISLNKTIMGYSTVQAENNVITGSLSDYDFDDYIFTLNERGIFKIEVSNIPVNYFWLIIYDENYNEINSMFSDGKSNINIETELSSGSYYLEFVSIPTSDSWRFPYIFYTSFVSKSGLLADFSSNVYKGCSPLNVNFTNNSTGNAQYYSWKFIGGNPSTSTIKNPQVTYSEAGVFPVELTISNASDSSSIKKVGYITVLASPNAEFTFSINQSESVSFINQTQYDYEVPTYKWDFGDSQTSNDVSPLHYYQNDDEYSVKLTASNTCGNSSIVKQLDLRMLSAEVYNIQSNVTVFPNPSKNSFTLRIESTYIGECNISLVNNFGQLLKSEKQMKSDEVVEFEYDFSDRPAGIYYIQVQTVNEFLMRKVIKE